MFNTQNIINIINIKRPSTYILNKKNYIQRKLNSTPLYLSVAEDLLLLKGGVLYGFTGKLCVGGGVIDCLQHFEIGSVSAMELTGYPPVHACLYIKYFLSFWFLIHIQFLAL